MGTTVCDFVRLSVAGGSLRHYPKDVDGSLNQFSSRMFVEVFLLLLTTLSIDLTYIEICEERGSKIVFVQQSTSLEFVFLIKSWERSFNSAPRPSSP